MIDPLFANNPTALVLIGLAAVFWVVGGNILIAFHYRRRGVSWWGRLKPSNFAFVHFNGREWLILLILAILSLGCGFSAVVIGVTDRIARSASEGPASSP
jgi:hypothetical protein